MDDVVVEGMLVVAAGRAYAGSRMPALARPRRGSADLPDRDGPERTAREEPVVLAAAAPGARWTHPASLGIAAVVGTVLARAALLI